MYSTGLFGEYRRSAIQDIKLPKCGMKKLLRTAMPQLLTTPDIVVDHKKRPTPNASGRCASVNNNCGDNCILLFVICSRIMKICHCWSKGYSASRLTVAFVGSVKRSQKNYWHFVLVCSKCSVLLNLLFNLQTVFTLLFTLLREVPLFSISANDDDGSFISKPRSNDNNISTQHIATLLGAACCTRLATLFGHVGCCWL